MNTWTLEVQQESRNREWKNSVCRFLLMNNSLCAGKRDTWQKKGENEKLSFRAAQEFFF